MISDIDAYRMLMICNLHFTNEKFDCTKTSSIRNLNQRFELLSHKEKKLFASLGKYFTDKQEYCKMLIANYMEGKDPRYQSVNDSLAIYKEYVSRKESLRYRLELDKESLGESPDTYLLLNSFLSNVCTPEYIILLDSINPFLDSIYNKIEFIGYKEVVLRLKKFRSFFKPSKYHEIITQ